MVKENQDEDNNHPQDKEYHCANTIRDRYGIRYLTLLNWTKSGVLPAPIRLNRRVIMIATLWRTGC